MLTWENHMLSSPSVCVTQATRRNFTINTFDVRVECVRLRFEGRGRERRTIRECENVLHHKMKFDERSCGSRCLKSCLTCLWRHLIIHKVQRNRWRWCGDVNICVENAFELNGQNRADRECITADYEFLMWGGGWRMSSHGIPQQMAILPKIQFVCQHFIN